MRISAVTVRNLRSIDRLTLQLPQLALICGPNSCGKSNCMTALRLAFQRDVSLQEIYEHLPVERRDSPGPQLSVYVDVTFADCPAKVRTLAGASGQGEVTYSFRAYRNGKVTRKLGDNVLDSIEQLEPYFSVVYVPPIRDIAAEGMQPFHLLFAEAMRRRRGERTLPEMTRAIRTELRDRANRMLGAQREFAQVLLGARRLVANTEHITLDGMKSAPTLHVEFGDSDVVPLEALGTGHQSAVIINLYRQLGEQRTGDTLFLFEEPDNHLHPSTVRAIGDDLRRLSESAQVIATTHSPVLINHLGFAALKPLHRGGDKKTRLRAEALPADDDKELRALLTQFGVRATEPLLARRVIVVEGPADATVVAELCEQRTKRTPDQLDVLVVPANGKAGVARLAALFHQMGCDWRAVFDRDAAYRADAPFALPNVDVAQALAGLAALQAVLDTSRKRGRGMAKTLRQLEAELQNGYAPPPPLDGSPLSELLQRTKPLTQQERTDLVSALRLGRERVCRTILGERGIVLWSGSIEDALLRRPGSELNVEGTLIRAGKLSGPIGGDALSRTAQIRAVLHGCGEEPARLRAVVQDLYSADMFRRTEVSAAHGVLFGGL